MGLSISEKTSPLAMQLQQQVDEHLEMIIALRQDTRLMDGIAHVAESAIETYRRGNKLLIAGNGGSAADAQHIAGELVSRFYFDRDALPAIALTTDSSILTAIGNDYGYEQLFSRQVQANGVKGDMFLGISTSGKSPNIMKAIEVCQERGIMTVGLTGQSGGLMAEHCDFCLRMPSAETPRIQEAHIIVGHYLCAAIEAAIFG